MSESGGRKRTLTVKAPFLPPQQITGVRCRERAGRAIPRGSEAAGKEQPGAR